MFFLVFSLQLVLFGLNNQLVVSYKEENTMALKNLFLKDYSGVDEDDYSVAVYTQQDVYDSLFYVLDQASSASSPYSLMLAFPSTVRKMKSGGCNVAFMSCGMAGGACSSLDS